ncbi:MAG TPA: T9SS type A sorting domain-containing protein, partial [Chryseolinea sp.]|nr:T9SS type A sorting domain-containing protein [Chryseolinea sp.]
SDVALYPNPVVDDLVRVSVPMGINFVLEVYDVTGRRMMVREGNSEELSSFNTTSLRNGQYMLRITSGAQVTTHKFVVQR